MPSDPLREVSIRLNDSDYFRFLAEANENGETAQELLFEIVNYYILVNKKRYTVKFKQAHLKKLDL